MTALEFNREFDQVDSNLRRFALSLTRSAEDAKDLVQETVYRAYWNRERFTSGTNFKAWVMTIMRNAYVSSYRKASRRLVVGQPDAHEIENSPVHAIDNAAASNLSLKEIHTKLKELPPMYRLPFTMFYRGYRYDEIARHMQVPVGTVKSRIFYARRKLRAQLSRT